MTRTQYTIYDDRHSLLWVTSDADIAEAHSKQGRTVSAVTTGRGVR